MGHPKEKEMRKYFKILVVVISLVVCSVGWAEEDAMDATATTASNTDGRGVGPVEDVQGVMNKATALLSGNLEMTMELNKNRTSEEDYTYNAIGQRVPKNTAVKTGGALHSE